jgi:cystathionine beta-lyase
MLLPSKTSHSLLSESDQAAQGITDQLIRFSVGIETAKDLIKDIEQAISASNLKK